MLPRVWRLLGAARRDSLLRILSGSRLRTLLGRARRTRPASMTNLSRKRWWGRAPPAGHLCRPVDPCVEGYSTAKTGQWPGGGCGWHVGAGRDDAFAGWLVCASLNFLDPDQNEIGASPECLSGSRRLRRFNQKSHIALPAPEKEAELFLLCDFLVFRPGRENQRIQVAGELAQVRIGGFERGGAIIAHLLLQVLGRLVATGVAGRSSVLS